MSRFTWNSRETAASENSGSASSICRILGVTPPATTYTWTNQVLWSMWLTWSTHGMYRLYITLLLSFLSFLSLFSNIIYSRQWWLQLFIIVIRARILVDLFRFGDLMLTRIFHGVSRPKSITRNDGRTFFSTMLQIRHWNRRLFS